jgi:cell division protein FtsZ
MGTGTASGDSKGEIAAHMALQSPLLEDISIEGARGVLINITGGAEMALHDIRMATETIYEAAGSGANIIFGAVVDETMGDALHVTVIATGFGKPKTSDTPGEEIDLFGFAPVERRGRIRKQRPRRNILDKVISPNYVDEDFKIPTFMRNVADNN